MISVLRQESSITFETLADVPSMEVFNQLSTDDQISVHRATGDLFDRMATAFEELTR